MDINSDIDCLSFEGNFVSLHIGTVLIVSDFVVLVYKNTLQLLSYQIFLQKTMKNTEGVLSGRGLAAPESAIRHIFSFPFR